MRIAVIVGVRPHFIKLSVLKPELQKLHDVTVINTGQHFDYTMSEIFFKELYISPPQFNLEVGSGTDAYQVGNALIKIERVLLDESFDMVLVIGDANPALAGALVAAKLGIKVGHIEAGVRSNDLTMPEEVNRLCIDQVSSLLFCSTPRSFELLKQTYPNRDIYCVGDLLLDRFKQSASDIENQSASLLKEFRIKQKGYVLITTHRASNTNNIKNLKNIVDAILALSIPIVFPMHPRTHHALTKSNLLSKLESATNIIITEPLSYISTMALIKHATCIITDSNGLQREAYFLNTPSIIIRNSTEYMETIESKCSVLAGTNVNSIVTAINEPTSFVDAQYNQSLFGDGTAGYQISTILSCVHPLSY